MAVEFFTGFDHYTGTEAPLGIWTTWSALNTIQSTVVRTGTNALRNDAGSNRNATKEALTNSSTRVFGSAYRTPGPFASVSSGYPSMVISDGGPLTAANAQIALVITNTGQIAVYRGRPLKTGTGGTLLGTSTSVLSVDTWYYIEIVVTHHASTGTVEVFVNGSKTGWIDLTGQNTAHSGVAQSNAIGLAGSEGIFTFFDDVYTATGTTRLNQPKCVAKVASSGNGTHAASTPSSGTDRGAMVDEATPDSDSTYNTLTNAGDKDTYNFAALGVTGTVRGLRLWNFTKKSDAGDLTSRAIALIGGSLYNGTTLASGSSYSYEWASHLWEQSPATAAAWTVAEIDNAEFGVERVA